MGILELLGIHPWALLLQSLGVGCFGTAGYIGYRFIQSLFEHDNIDSLRQHMHILGVTGTGKSTLIKHTLTKVLNHPRCIGACIIDPHGALARDVMGLVPEWRRSHVLFVDPTEERTAGINPLAFASEDRHAEMETIASDYVTLIRDLHPGSWGSRIEENTTMTIRAVLDYAANSGETVTARTPYDFMDDMYTRRSVMAHVTDPLIKRYWQTFDFTDRSVSRTLPKLRAPILSRGLRRVLDREDGINLRECLKRRKIVVCSLRKSKLLAGLITSALIRAAQSQTETNHLLNVAVLDEMQAYITSVASAADEGLAEVRKYGLGLIMAHQRLRKLGDLMDSVEQAASKHVFRVTQRDARTAKKYIAHEGIGADTLVSLPDYERVQIKHLGGAGRMVTRETGEDVPKRNPALFIAEVLDRQQRAPEGEEDAPDRERPEGIVPIG